MNPQPIETSIIIPAFNEAKRLPPTLTQLSQDLLSGRLPGIKLREVIIVDDGSTDGTHLVADGFQSVFPKIICHRNSTNRGKGFSVRSGLAQASAPWALVADADMSTPWTEVNSLVSQALSAKANIAIGSRDIAGSNIKVHQSWIREHLGKCFNLMVRFLTGLPYRDTQCGFKLLSMNHVRKFLSELSVDRFAWDVEVLICAQKHNLTTIEVPVSWEHKDESRVNPFFDGINMALTVLKLRFIHSNFKT